MDLLAQRISNGSEEMKSVFQKIFSRDVDDALVFDVDSITVEDITEFKEYHGLHVSFVGYLDRTKIPISIDIGFGDVIYPEAVKMDFPVILDMESPRVNAYSLETSIAEKLEAIIHNGYFNSRYKDTIVIADEIGNGIVPLDAFEREYREQTGRAEILLAKKADEVVRVICGIGQKIK